ncbi:MAG TPA: VanZ family protein [Cellulomonadaceae bacterium]|nr:VanZ family protein [Cellulomonadaceae bacterium]
MTGPDRRRAAPVVARLRLPWSHALLVAYTAFVLVVTWWPSPQSTNAPRWETTILDAIHGVGIPMTMPVLEALANVGMFVPLGMLLVPWWSARPTRRGRAAASAPARATAAVLVRTVLTGLALTIVIETVQLAIPGRYSTVQDVVMNTLGAAVGGGATLLVRRPRRG